MLPNLDILTTYADILCYSLGMSEMIAAAIRAERARKNMTQADLAEAAGMSRNTIVAIENGDVSPRVEQVGRIAKALDVHPAVLISERSAT